MSKPRRGLPPDDEQRSFEETELEISALRRGFTLDDDHEVRPRRSASRAADEDAPAVADVDFQPSRRPSRAAPDPAPAVKAPKPAKPGTAKAGKPRSQAKSVATKVPRLQPEVDRRGLIPVVAAALGSLVLGLGVGMVPAEEAPLPETVPLVTAISRNCPAADGPSSTLVAASSEGAILMRPVGQEATTTEDGPVQLPGQSAPVVLTPTQDQSSVTGGSLIEDDGKLWWGLCRAALSDQYVQLPGGSGARLLIVNSEAQDALIDITLSGPGGEITGEGLRGLTIAANSQQVVDLEPHADELDAVAARVRSSVGRVMVAGQVDRSTGADFATNTVQSTQVTISAIPAEAERAVLLLTNPGTGRNVVQIEGVSEAGRYSLPGYESYPLDAQRTVAVDLTEVLEGAPVGLVITGRDAFAASAVITRNDDFGIQPGQSEEQTASAVDLVSVIPGPGMLQVANPGEGEALVVIDWGADQAEASRTVAPGSVAAIEIPAGARMARVTSTAPIAAALLLEPAEGDGFAVALLHQAARSRASMPIQVERGLGR
ncbi:MAG: DUF5719 family protein [Brooklawnia sp.]|jgi:hypothetical protein